MHLTHINTAALASASFNLAHGFPNPHHAWSTSQSEHSLTYAIGHGLDGPIHDQLILSKRALTQDNTCGVTINGRHGWVCDPQDTFGGACCSFWGQCGNDTKYCGKGCQEEYGICQSQVALPDLPHCGPNHGNAKCPPTQCCSAEGFCGTTPAHCYSTGCHEGYGRCDEEATPKGPNPSSVNREIYTKFQGGTLISRCTQPGVVALTYNDGPWDYTEDLLDLLKSHNAKATFMVAANSIGKDAIDTTPKWQDVIKRMVAEGHQIGAHSWSHAYLSTLNSDARKLEIYKDERAIANILGKFPTYFRSPYSNCAKESGCIGDMDALGYHLVGYSLDTEDYKHGSASEIDISKNIVQRAIEPMGMQGNALVIQHDIIAQSVNLTEYILGWTEGKGWKAVTVGECIDDPSPNWYRQIDWTAPAAAPRGACVISQDQFCGQLENFKNKDECFTSNQGCFKQGGACEQAQPSVNGTACGQYNSVCEMQFSFCMQCGKDGSRTCDSEQFAYKN